MKVASQKKIIILVGRGKSTLTDFFRELCPDSVGVYCDEDLKKQADRIKSIVQGLKNYKVVIHLQDEGELKKLEAGILRRALVFKIDF